MRFIFLLFAVMASVTGCDSSAERKKGGEITLKEDLTKPPKDNKPMNRLDRIMGTLLETWNKRYAFEHDRAEPKLTFKVPGFTLIVVECGDSDKVAILFEEAGTNHRVECSSEEAPKLIEALLFPE